jgi:hypothetical protein
MLNSGAGLLSVATKICNAISQRATPALIATSFCKSQSELKLLQLMSALNETWSRPER